MPAALILVASGIGWVAGALDRERRRLGGVMAGLLLAQLGLDAVRRPAHAIRLHELRPLIDAHHPSWRSQQEEAFVLHVLDRRGQLRRRTRAPGASLHLYSQ